MKKLTGIESIIVNVGLIVCACLLLVFLINGSLKLFTQHGKEIVVPDFTNMTLSEARVEASKAGVKVSVGDSVYVSQMRKGAVYSQTPKAGASVKRGRRILVTTNTRSPKPVVMPNLRGSQMHIAKSMLSNLGLNLGKLIYTENQATNLVIDQVYHGKSIKEGAKVMSGSTIDLVVGFNAQDARVAIPNLKGKKYVYAIDAIHDNSFNVGKVKFDSSVKTYVDSLNAVVISQKPAADGRIYNMGKDIAIELSLDPDKLNQ